MNFSTSYHGLRHGPGSSSAVAMLGNGSQESYLWSATLPLSQKCLLCLDTNLYKLTARLAVRLFGLWLFFPSQKCHSCCL